MMGSVFSPRALFLELILLALLVAAAVAAADPEFYLVCGKGTGCWDGDERKADAAEFNEVRCCSDSFVGGWNKRSSCLVWAASDLDGCHTTSHALAAQRCAGAGANGRLCTREELAAQCTRGSGCGFDHALVWSSSPVVDYQQELQELREDLEEQGEDLQEQLQQLLEAELAQQEAELQAELEELRVQQDEDRAHQGEEVGELRVELHGQVEEAVELRALLELLEEQGEQCAQYGEELQQQEAELEELREQREGDREQFEGVLGDLRAQEDELQELRVQQEAELEQLRAQREDDHAQQEAELQQLRAQLQELLALVVQDRCLCAELPSGAPSVVPSGSPSSGPSCTPATCVWTQLGADIDGEAICDWSGYSMAVSGDGATLAVGATLNDGTGHLAGHVRVYTWDLPTKAWTQMGADIDGEALGDQSGYSVTLSNDGATLAVGAPYNDGTASSAGHVRVYKLDLPAKTWVKMGADIDGEASNDLSGWSVALSGDGSALAVGAIDNDGTAYNAGHVRVYKLDLPTKTWTKMGSDLDGEAVYDGSGWDVALSDDGTTLVVGAPDNDGTGKNTGHVRVYKLDIPTKAWTQMGVDLDGEASCDYSGLSVAVSGDGATLAVGATWNDGTGYNAGHVRVYKWDLPTKAWTQMGADIDGEASGDQSGYSVSLSGDGATLAVGARYNDGTASDAGHVRVFQLDVTTKTWTQMGADVDGEASGDFSGYSVSLSNDGATLAIGAPYNDGTGSDAGHVRVYGWAKKL